MKKVVMDEKVTNVDISDDFALSSGSMISLVMRSSLSCRNDAFTELAELKARIKENKITCLIFRVCNPFSVNCFSVKSLTSEARELVKCSIHQQGGGGA